MRRTDEFLVSQSPKNDKKAGGIFRIFSSYIHLTLCRIIAKANYDTMRQLDAFSRFATIHPCDQPTNHPATSATLCHNIYAMRSNEQIINLR